jgi:cyclic-di-AMP phosphodiesterase PgpH
MGTDSQKKIANRSRRKEQLSKWLLLLSIVVIFLVLLYPSLVIQRHTYQLGDIAERDIKTPRDFFVEDEAASTAIRRQAVESVLTVYDYDPRILSETTQKLRDAFGRIHKLLASYDSESTRTDAGQPQPATELDAASARQKFVWAQKEAFEKQIGLKISENDYRLLTREGFDHAIPELIIKILNQIQSNGVVSNKEILLKQIDRGITMRNVATQREEKAAALRQLYGPDQAKTMVRIVAAPHVKDMPLDLVNLMVDLCQRLVQPNITLNRNETEKRKKQALSDAKPILYQFKAGEMLVREGERINAEQLVKLNALNQQKENHQVVPIGLGAALIIATLLAVFKMIYLHQPRHSRLNKTKNLVFMGLVLVIVIVIVKISVVFSAALLPNLPVSIPAASMVYAAPAAAGAMLVCLFLGFEIALPFSLVVAVCAAMLTGDRVEIFVFFLISSTMAAFWVKHCRERKVIIVAGIQLGLINLALATATSIYAANYAGLKLPWDWAMAFCGGMGSAIVTVGLGPLLEMSFRYTTDISLLELANLDRPILRRLMIEAPGTYHHSVIVGSLVEAAATEIGANPLLARVCAYYHDIGKINKPLYFIENQTMGKNKHDKLAPSMSSLILTAHVKEGVDIARQNKLGQSIIDTIQQHHGTSLIAYFFNKAIQLKGEDAVKINDYRYPGPKPQTKEAGLVMLADVVEAALRTLDNPTPARIQGSVQKLINKIFADGQLDSCELTLRDLHRIASSFNKILYGIYHHRIEYGDMSNKENVKEKNASSDRQPTDKPSGRDPKGSKEDPGHLKRLGLS